jgi:Fic family protein
MYSLQKISGGKYATPSQFVRMIHEVAQSKGRQELFNKRDPEVLKRLVDLAIIESVRASTAIEGVKVPPLVRLKEMVEDAGWKPGNRDEEDVLAYKNALAFIYDRPKRKRLSVEFILQISKILWAHDTKKIGLKKSDNKIVLKFPDGTQVFRFQPPSAKDTPKLLERTCMLFHQTINEEGCIDHQVIAAFILDFLCIHPLEDGNGRLARLLHTFLLLQNEYEVGRYVSLEGLIEQNKKNYYDSLYQSSKEWASGKHTMHPWMNFCLGKLNLAYKRFERQVDTARETFAAGIRRPEQHEAEKLLETMAIGQNFERSFVEREAAVSGRTARRVLEAWVRDGRLLKQGLARATRYKKLR